MRVHKLTIRTELCANANVFESTDTLRREAIDRNSVGGNYSLFALSKKWLTRCVCIGRVFRRMRPDDDLLVGPIDQQVDLIPLLGFVLHDHRLSVQF